MSDFAALNTALSGLLAHRRVSEVIGQNLANVNTEGYSRQRVELVGAGSGVVPAMFSTTTRPGSGVDIVGQIRVRDEFMERRALGEQATSSSLAQQAQILSRVEMTTPEPSDTSMATKLAEFRAAWDDVANQPDSTAVRSQLLERAVAVTDAFNSAATELGDLRNGTRDQLMTTIDQVNATAARVAELNDSIRASVAGGLYPNELMDQRDVLVRQLTDIVGATARDGELGTVDLSIAGTAIVRGGRAERLVVTELPVTAPGAGDAAGAVGWSNVQVQWARDGYPATLTAGQAHGMVQGINDLIPRHLDELNALSVQLRTEVNTVHATGYGLDGVNGRAFFAAPPAGPPYAGAASTMGLSADVAGQPGNVGASGLGSPVGNLDATVAQQLAALGQSPTSTDAAYRSYIGRVGVEVQTVNRRQATQDMITKQVDAQRLSVSGVNIDEEMVNLAASQHAYNAAARLMTTIDSMIDTLINRTGLVGR